jgi:hypothetical protein
MVAINAIGAALQPKTLVCECKPVVCPSGQMKQAVSSPTVIRSISNEELKDLMRDKFPNAQFRGIENWGFILVPKAEVQDHVKDFLIANSFSGEESDREMWLLSSFFESGWERVPVGWAKFGGNQGDFFVFVVVDHPVSHVMVPMKINPDGSLTELYWEAGVGYVFIY